ncbi:radical SAM protein [Longimicrobium sp.]|uniref:radical SAM protein n=1 Tax=Longimicrobium sp. TaxID=2029185 RepID=UPI003B3A3699
MRILPTPDMQTSPLDRDPSVRQPSLVKLGYTPKARWVPSRYNARTVGHDGRLILWNTYTGAISVFQPKDRDRVLAALSVSGVEEPLGSTASYLVRRGYLVTSSVSELDKFRYRYGREQFRTDILQLILLASEDCNFRCVYCYEKFQRGTMSPEVRHGLREMVTKRAPRLNELDISWFGGEPLYGWEAVEELAPFFKRVADEHGIRHRQNMTTNAYLLTEERATRLLEWGCRTYQITIDGLPDQHNCKRVGRDGSPTYHVILDNLRSLKARDDVFSVIVRVNFDRDNVMALGAFLEALSEDFGGDPRFKLRFRAVGKWGGSNDQNLDTCGLDEQKAVLAQLREKAGEVDLGLEAGVRRMASFGSEVCYAARPYNFIVGASGKLMKCTVVLEELESNVVGQILPDGTMDLKDEYMAQWVKPYFETDPLCQKCYVLPICQGSHCPLPRITENNTRQCSSVKKELKFDMRFTLAGSDRSRATDAAAGLVVSD